MKGLPILKPAERKVAYQSDIIYGTNNEFGFDYLRDNMVSALYRKWFSEGIIMQLSMKLIQF